LIQLKPQFKRVGHHKYMDLSCHIRLYSFGTVWIHNWKGRLVGASLWV